MNWYRKLFRAPGQKTDAVRLLNLRCTRFRQLVRNYGKILDALADAADKQGGDYILDRQYIVSLSETVIDLTEAVIFDLNVLAEQRYESFYNLLDRFREEIRDIITSHRSAEKRVDDGSREATPTHAPTSTVDPKKLAKSVAESPALYQHVGQVACRGVAAGPVFNLETEEDPGVFPPGAVMVASDIGPDDELIRLMGRASAILTDFGGPARDAATLAREFKVPTIVGLGDVTRRLDTGTEVTVDADENTVYLGCLPEIIEYYHTERLDHEEEEEYRTLRKLRRIMFALTLNENAESPSRLDDCKTLHDLIHLAHELAGEVQFELIRNLRDLKKVSCELATGFDIPFCVVDVGDGLAPVDPDTGSPGLGEIRSTPLRVFVLGMDQVFRQGPHAFRSGASRVSVTTTVTEEHANVVVQQPGGFDIVDSMIGDSKESNHIYCRFASAGQGNDEKAARGAVTREILSRLDFAAAGTARATAAWLSGVPRVDMEERLTIVGRLGARLLETDSSGWGAVSCDTYVDTFMAQHV
jgi:pyruvate,water dikinase